MKLLQQLTCLTLGRPNGPAYSTPRDVLQWSIHTLLLWPVIVYHTLYVCGLYFGIIMMKFILHNDIRQYSTYRYGYTCKNENEKSENINVHQSMICLSTVIYSCNVNYFVPFMYVRGFECMWIDKCLEMIKTRRLWF